MTRSKKKGSVTPNLSPRNYIRQKARTLPIYECLVNAAWQESKLAHVIIARQHSNSNISACMYLVDLMCLGVKDTDFFFNLTLSEYKQIISVFSERNEIVSISYALAHNIVYEGLGFAEDYGFFPCADFSSVTCYMLEEDNEKVELIGIECGQNGKPTYTRSPGDNPAKISNIISKLQKTAGIGNFRILDEIDEKDMAEFEAEDENDVEVETDSILFEFSEMPFEEKVDIFRQLSEKLNLLTPDDLKRFSYLTSSLFYDFCDEELIDKYYDEESDIFNIDILPDREIPNELLGIKPGSNDDNPEIKKMFLDIHNSLEENTENIRDEWESFRKKAGEIPAVSFLELNILKTENSDEYEEKIKEYHLLYEDYSMIKLLWHIELITSEKFSHKNFIPELSLKAIFPGRQTIHRIELYYYFFYYLLMLGERNDPSRLEAFLMVMKNIEEVFTEGEYAILIHTTLYLKLKMVVDHLKIDFQKEDHI